MRFRGVDFVADLCLVEVVLSDMFMHVTTKFLWHCWTQAIFTSSWAAEVAS